jgi:predicted ATPase
VQIQGDGDIADICRLTCLEQGIAITESPEAPLVELRDLQVILHLEETKEEQVPISTGLEE